MASKQQLFTFVDMEKAFLEHFERLDIDVPSGDVRTLAAQLAGVASTLTPADLPELGDAQREVITIKTRDGQEKEVTVVDLKRMAAETVVAGLATAAIALLLGGVGLGAALGAGKLTSMGTLAKNLLLPNTKKFAKRDGELVATIAFARMPSQDPNATPPDGLDVKTIFERVNRALPEDFKFSSEADVIRSLDGLRAQGIVDELAASDGQPARWRLLHWVLTNR